MVREGPEMSNQRGRHSGELKHFLKGFEKNIGGVKPANLTTSISVLRGCLYTVHLHGGLALHDENVSIYCPDNFDAGIL